MNIPMSRDDIEDIKHSLDELNQNSGWHAPPYEVWVEHKSNGHRELVASQRVISAFDGAQLQVMTYSGNCYTASPAIILTTVGTYQW